MVSIRPCHRLIIHRLQTGCDPSSNIFTCYQIGNIDRLGYRIHFSFKNTKTFIPHQIELRNITFIFLLFLYLIMVNQQPTTKRKTPESKLEKVLNEFLIYAGSSMEEATLIPHGARLVLTYSAMFNPQYHGQELQTAKGIEEVFYQKFAPFLYTKDPTIRSIVSVHECTQKEKRKALYNGQKIYQLTLLLHLDKKYEDTVQKLFQKTAESEVTKNATGYGFD